MSSTHLHQLLNVGRMSEANYLEVARVDFQQRPRVLRDGRLVVAGVGPIGRPHLHQGCAALLQHVGNAEAAPYLHRLAAGDDDLFPGGNGREAQKYGGSVVIDQKRCLRPRQMVQQPLKMGLPRTPTARLQVDFQVAVPRGSGVHRGGGFQAEWRPAQVRVNDYPRSVYDRRRLNPAHPSHTLSGLPCNLLERRRRLAIQSLNPRLLDTLPNGVYQPGMAILVR